MRTSLPSLRVASISAALFALAALTAPRAYADAPPPNSAGCTGKSAGASCALDTGGSGTCVAATCSGLDYSNRNDAGAPGTKTYACVLCEGASVADGGASDGGTTGGDSDGGSCSFGGSAEASIPLLLAALVPIALRRRGGKR